MTKLILKQEADSNNSTKRIWNDLFIKSDFFNKYKHFIVLSATADESDAYNKW